VAVAMLILVDAAVVVVKVMLEVPKITERTPEPVELKVPVEKLIPLRSNTPVVSVVVPTTVIALVIVVEVPFIVNAAIDLLLPKREHVPPPVTVKAVNVPPLDKVKVP
jgi:hypothetical protein